MRLGVLLLLYLSEELKLTGSTLNVTTVFATPFPNQSRSNNSFVFNEQGIEFASSYSNLRYVWSMLFVQPRL